MKADIHDQTKEGFDGHPIVATTKLLNGDAKPFPGLQGVRRPTGRISKVNLKTIESIAEALFSVEGVPPPLGRIRWLVQEYVDYMSRVSVLGRFLFVCALFFVSSIAPIMVFRFRPLRRLSLDRRILALTRYESSAIGTTLIPIKAIICIIYYEHPDAAREVGIDIERPRSQLFGTEG